MNEKVKKAQIITTDTEVRWVFAYGEPITIRPSEFSEDIQLYLMVHGAKQKICDSYAGATPEEARELAIAVIEGLKAGKRTIRVEGGPRLTQIVVAFAAIAGCSIEDAQTAYDNMTEEQQADLKKHKQIKAKIAELRAEAAIAAADKAAEEARDSEPLTHQPAAQ